MNRREFLGPSALAAFLAFSGCRSKPVDVKTSSPPEVDWQQKIADVVGEHIEGIELDPITIGLIAQLLFQLIQACLVNKMLAQHKAVSRKPEGRVAKAWKANVAKAFKEKNPDVSEDTTTEYVDAAFEAFRESTEPQLKEAFEGIAKAPRLSNADWERASRTIEAINTSE